MCQNCSQYQEFAQRYQVNNLNQYGLGYVNPSLQQRLCEYLSCSKRCSDSPKYPELIWSRLANFKKELFNYGLEMDDWFKCVEGDLERLI